MNTTRPQIRCFRDLSERDKEKLSNFLAQTKCKENEKPPLSQIYQKRFTVRRKIPFMNAVLQNCNIKMIFINNTTVRANELQVYHTVNQ